MRTRKRQLPEPTTDRWWVKKRKVHPQKTTEQKKPVTPMKTTEEKESQSPPKETRTVTGEKIVGGTKKITKEDLKELYTNIKATPSLELSQNTKTFSLRIRPLKNAMYRTVMDSHDKQSCKIVM